MSTQRWMLSVLLVIALLAPGVVAPAPAQAGGVVTVCDETHLLAALAGGGAVTFACSGTITLSAEIVISADTTIDGSGQAVTISGNNAVRVFHVNSGTTLSLTSLTIANGRAIGDAGGGVKNSGGALIVSGCAFIGNKSAEGGGIMSGGPLTVRDSVFHENSAGSGGAIAVFGTATVSNCTFTNNSSSWYGGGIFNAVNLLVSESTFSRNSAGEGGAIFSDGALTIENSTFERNHAIHGGGVACFEGWPASVSNSTFFRNGKDGIHIYQNSPVQLINSTISGNEGGITNLSDLAVLKNTIVANNMEGSQCTGYIIDGGGNLSYPDATCPGINGDPILGPLQDNGGPTWTMALGEGSAAINAADDAICAAPPVNNLDQRGVTRPQGIHCDIGAVEQIIEPTAVNLIALNASGVPDSITPMLIFGLLLAGLAGMARGNGNCR